MQQETPRSTVIPGLRYRDAHAAIEWLCSVLGFERRLVAPHGEDEIAHAQLTVTVLLPAQITATDFYDEQGLKAAFSWYPRLIGEIHTTNRNLSRAVGERAVPTLEEDRDELAAQFRWPF